MSCSKFNVFHNGQTAIDARSAREDEDDADDFASVILYCRILARQSNAKISLSRITIAVATICGPRRE